MAARGCGLHGGTRPARQLRAAAALQELRRYAQRIRPAGAPRRAAAGVWNRVGELCLTTTGTVGSKTRSLRFRNVDRGRRPPDAQSALTGVRVGRCVVRGLHPRLDEGVDVALHVLGGLREGAPAGSSGPTVPVHRCAAPMGGGPRTQCYKTVQEFVSIEPGSVYDSSASTRDDRSLSTPPYRAQGRRGHRGLGVFFPGTKNSGRCTNAPCSW